ncbi:lactadherin-like isoform X1 [Orbicella faveolata]|uniref:lactadherin-like isoform X1 n=1 Tax=Orbicella faveolata TaxID=48498 RepID=UPI0009E2179E|nr:lactadherin-like isoform X1 [Orbicella faveolata]
MWFERFTSFSILLFYFSSQSRLVSSALRECNRPLGLQDGRILNSQLSSPSHFEHLYIGNGKNVNLKAEFARLNNSLAWCSPSTKNSDSTFIEIDLHQQVNISGIATQGFMGINAYYVKQYKVAYSKDRITWKLSKKTCS